MTKRAGQRELCLNFFSLLHSELSQKIFKYACYYFFSLFSSINKANETWLVVSCSKFCKHNVGGQSLFIFITAENLKNRLKSWIKSRKIMQCNYNLEEKVNKQIQCKNENFEGIVQIHAAEIIIQWKVCGTFIKHAGAVTRKCKSKFIGLMCTSAT